MQQHQLTTVVQHVTALVRHIEAFIGAIDSRTVRFKRRKAEHECKYWLAHMCHSESNLRSPRRSMAEAAGTEDKARVIFGKAGSARNIFLACLSQVSGGWAERILCLRLQISSSGRW